MVQKFAAILAAFGLALTISACNTETNTVPFTVIFDSDGGSSVDSQSIESGNTATKPTDPTKEYFTFDNWYYENSPFDFSTPITGDITLTAKWNPITYTIKFDKNGGEGTMNDLVMKYNEEKNLPENAFTRNAGWTFLGWSTNKKAAKETYDNKQSIKNLTTDNEATITLYAIWQYKNYIDDDGNLIIDGETYPFTSFVKVMDKDVVVEGTDENWSSYEESNATGYKGVFLAGRNVKLSPFSIAQYEVTQKLYEKVMNTGTDYSTYGKGDNYPAYYISWYSAITFCNKLSLLMGKTRCYTLADGTYPDEADSIPTDETENWYSAVCDWEADGYRLPTDAEWEFAARGGDQSAQEWKYAFAGIQSKNQIIKGSNNSGGSYADMQGVLSHDENLDTVGWYGLNAEHDKVSPVGKKNPNTLNIYDMSGNEWEWVWDGYAGAKANDDLYTIDDVIVNPKGKPNFANKVFRGGAFNTYAGHCCVSRRTQGTAHGIGYNMGFRLAQSF